MNNAEHSTSTFGDETVLTHCGRHPKNQDGFVNTPIVRGSTVLFETYEDLIGGANTYRYGRHGNPTNDAVIEVITKLENAHETFLTPSGLSAISTALTAVAHAGDHVLISDSAYEPTRHFCETVLRANKVDVEYYDPRIGNGISALLRENTKVILTESPGSLTFEVQDLPAIAQARGDRDIAIIADNSWATPLFYKPLDLGADVVIHAGTKMFVGHSDVLFGTISANEKWSAKIHATYSALGICVSPEDSFLVARGLRTLSIRMKEHQQRALDLAKWLETLPAVDKVFHPALGQHPDNEIFIRDFKGSGSLFAFTLHPAPQKAVSKMLNHMRLFGMGYSWGGFESLILPIVIKKQRSATKWAAEGNLFRVHVGLEDFDDIKADLGDAIARYTAAANL